MVKVHMPTLDEDDFQKFGNGLRMGMMLERIAQEVQRRAIAIYVGAAKNPYTVRPFYANSFFVRKQMINKYMGRVVENTDPTWKWIEFGAHAGGKTLVLKYRPIGRAMDEIKGGRRA